mgnify:CR=1 FL=1
MARIRRAILVKMTLAFRAVSLVPIDLLAWGWLVGYGLPGASGLWLGLPGIGPLRAPRLCLDNSCRSLAVLLRHGNQTH